MRDAAPQGTYKVQALDRAFAVLDLLGESETPLGLAQVAASLQLHKSTAHRFLMVLERHRMVERTTTGKFRLGLRLFDFGNRAIEQYDLRERAQPHLRRLVAETEETAHLHERIARGVARGAEAFVVRAAAHHHEAERLRVEE